MSRFLVKYRIWIFALMVILVALSALAIPHINVNTDMTKYMPDDYPMKQGLDLVEQQLPDLMGQMKEFGSLFADGNDLMPTDLPQTLATGVALLFAVLLLMCSSVMEVVLFLITTGFAVALNMGTNALLPSVSTMTNMLSPVLQMVLSMDYCIILMNRYRQEKLLGKAPEEAMQGAIGSASSSIMSSAFTTIVSLLMLNFIKLKIGADLGMVLSKGVAFSFLCTFTVLPTLILWGDKAVEKTRKKVPVFPSEKVARFEYKARYVLVVLFVAVFATFAFLQKKTRLSFSPTWQSSFTGEQSNQNAALLLYPNTLEDSIPELLDTLGALPNVLQGISYPSLVKRARTVEQMQALFSDFAPEQASALSSDMLSLVYYARFRSERKERLSFNEMMDLVDELQAQGLVPEGFDKDAMMPQLPVEEPPVVEEPIAEVSVAEESVILGPDWESPVDTLSTSVDTLSVAPAHTLVAPVAEPSSAVPFTYEDITREYTATEMARLLELDRSQVTMLYRMAGRRNQTMTPVEVMDFVQEKILPNKRYAAFMPKGAKEEFGTLRVLVDSVLAAGPTAKTIQADSVLLADVPEVPAAADTLIIAPADTVLVALAPKEHSVIPGPDRESPAPEEIVPPTPLEVLADMAFSSMRYSSARIYSALHAAGIGVPKEQLDLLFLYSGARKGCDPSWKMSPEELLNFVADTLIVNPALAGFIPDSTRTLVTESREELLSGVGQLCGPDYSGAVLISTYAPESDSTSTYVQQLRQLANDALPEPHYWIGESEMYKELEEGFPQELLILTLMTILAIFVIVAINFRSVFIPIPLIMTILSGVYVNVWASGLGGNTMYYLSYLIIQGILMGATIDYTILFTHYYRAARKEADVAPSIAGAFEGSSHSILTSGLILIIVPYIMAFTMSDPMIAAILRSLGTGALAVVLLVMFVLPGVIAALDPLFNRQKA